MKAKIKTYSLFFVAIAMMVASCVNRVDEVDLDSVITVNPERNSMLANGLDQVKVTVNISPKADDKYRTIVLQFDGGKIDGQDGNVEKVVNAQGNAVFTLQSGTITGNYTVKAFIKGHTTFEKTEEMVLEGVNVNNVLHLSLSDTTQIQADGISIFKLQVAVSNHSASSVEITATEGTFVDNNQNNITLFLDSTGVAETEVRTSLNALPHSFTAKVASPEYQSYISFTPVAFDVNNVMSLTLSDTLNDVADNNGSFLVTADISNYPVNTIKFAVTHEGNTNDHQVNVVGGVAQYLVNLDKKASEYQIQAKVEYNSATILSNPVSFTPGVAYPDFLNISPTAWSIDSSAVNQNIVVNVARSIGEVSDGIPLQLEAFQSTPAVVNYGSFNPIIPVISNQASTIVYSTSPGLDVSLPLNIVVSSGSVSDTIQLLVNPN